MGSSLWKKIYEFDPTAKIVFVTMFKDIAFLTFIYKREALDYIIKEEEEKLQKKVINCIDIAINRYQITYLSTREPKLDKKWTNRYQIIY